MLLTQNSPALQATDPTNKKRDPLGLAPLPIENRQRYLRFMLSQKSETLIPLTDILEVMQLAFADMLPVPGMPSCVRGVCSWQGETLWLVDLNHMMGSVPSAQQSQRSLSQPSTSAQKPTIIVVQAQQKSLGLVVESVSDIDLFDPSHIRMEKGLCPPSLEPYVMGYCPEQAGTVLNVSKIIHSPLLQSHETSPR